MAAALTAGLGLDLSKWTYPPLLPTQMAAVIFFPLGEEFGWRGFAYPRLRAQFGLVGGSLVVGALWSLWHLGYMVNMRTGEVALVRRSNGSEVAGERKAAPSRPEVVSMYTNWRNQAAKKLPQVQSPVTELADSDVDNANDTVDPFRFGGILKRVLAQVEIVESHSAIEGWWRGLKYFWLYLLRRVLNSSGTIPP